MFKQKCEHIFEGPLGERDEAKKVMHMLLWISNSGLDIYNAVTFSNKKNKLRIELVLEKLGAKRKLKSNKILIKYKLRVHKQESMTIEEFVTSVKQLVKKFGYPDIKDDMRKDMLMYRVESDHRDSIRIGDDLTFKQMTLQK